MRTLLFIVATVGCSSDSSSAWDPTTCEAAGVLEGSIDRYCQLCGCAGPQIGELAAALRLDCSHHLASPERVALCVDALGSDCTAACGWRDWLHTAPPLGCEGVLESRHDPSTAETVQAILCTPVQRCTPLPFQLGCSIACQDSGGGGWCFVPSGAALGVCLSGSPP